MKGAAVWGAVFALAAWPSWAAPKSLEAWALRAWLENGAAVVVLDLRGRADYMRGTVVGAVAVGGRSPAQVALPEGTRRVVLLMPDGGARELAETWGRVLALRGLEVYRLDGGLAAWRAAGGEVEVPAVTYARPDEMPFVIPRGLCEMNTPAQIFK